MKSLKIKGHIRESLGKKEAKKLRKQELVPAVLYGREKTLHITVPFKEMRPLVYTPNIFIVELDIDGEVYNAIIQDIQWHPVEEEILHIDFLKIDADRPVKIAIPIKFTGMAAGVKAGGKLKTNMRKLKVKALAQDLPDFVEVDITKLDIGDNIKVKELKDEKLTFLDNSSNLIVAVVSTRVVQAANPLPEEEGEAAEGEATAEGESSEQ